MVSKKNIEYKRHQEAKKIPHYGLRKLSVGVASVLLGTVVYMQNGSIVHADVNPTVSAGNDNVKIADENVGVGYSAGASSGTSSAGSAVTADGTIDQGNNAAAASEPENVASSGQVNASANQVTASDNIKVGAGSAAEPNRPANVVSGNSSNGRWFTNLQVKPSVLAVSKVASTDISDNTANGGFDQNTWGTLDVSKWTGQENNGVYELTGYTGDLEHIIVPNSADFAKAGRNVGQVGISADTTHSWFEKGSPKSIAFSKTGGRMVKAVGYDWTSAFTGMYARGGFDSSQAHALTLFDGDNLDTSNITNMHYIFAENKLADLSGVSNWKTDNVTNMNSMFSYNQISDLTPLSNWKTDNVADMGSMFTSNQISDLAPLANWKTDNVTYMSGMFWRNRISDLTPLANWKTGNVTDMFRMFWGNQISDLAPIANWKTGNVTNMYSMFNGNQISYADFTKWNFGNVPDLFQFINQSTPGIIIIKNADQTLFSNSQAIITKQNQLHFGLDTVDMPTVYVASDKADARQKILADINTKISEYQTNHTDKMLMSTVPLDQLTELVDLANAKFTVKHTLPELDTNDAFALNSVNGLHEHKNVNDNGGYDTDFWGTLDVSKFTTVKNGDNLEIIGYTGDASKVIIPNIADFWVNGLDQDAKQVTISSSVMRQLAKNATRIGLSKTNNQKVVAGDANWSNAFGGLTINPQTNDIFNGGMWVYNPSLTVMDLHNLDTINITNMGLMFNGGRNLKVVGDLSQWNTANVINMSMMFNQASSLTNIGNLDNWDTSKVTNMNAMFNAALKLVNIGDLAKWDVSNVTNMSDMFSSTLKLTNIGDLSKWDVSSVTNMSGMFYAVVNLANIGDLSKWDVSNVTNMSVMFQGASSLTNIGDLDNWDTSKVTDMSAMFNQTFKLANIGDLSKWNVSNVTNMSNMFGNASRLTNIGDLSKWDTSKVTYMLGMFYNTESLKQLNISNWDLTRLTGKYAFSAFVNGDPNLVVIANNVKLPTWYQNELSNSNDFWNDHLAVITNNGVLLKATGSVDNVTVDNASVKRSVFYDSKGSDDAVAVLKQANQAYIKQYQSEHPGYILTLAADVDQTDPIALANAKFVSVPLDVQFKLAYYDLTGKLVDSTTNTHKVGDTVLITPVAPANYVLVSGQTKVDYLMRWGLNEADFLVEPKLTQTTETKTVSRTIKVQTPNGQTQNVVQTVKFVRNGYLNEVTKQTAYSPWSFGGQYQFSGYQPKPIDGYSVDVAPAVIVTPDSSDTLLSLAYHKLAADYSVVYQLANGKMVANVSVTPDSDGRIQLTAPQGYRLLTPVTDMQVGHSSQKLAVFVVPDEQTYTVKDTLPSVVTEPLTKTITRTVKIAMPNGHIRMVKQVVKFERTATVEADGTVVYSDWQALGRAQFNKVFVAKRHGYHLVFTNASGKVLTDVAKIDHVTTAMNDEVVDVKYVKD